MRLQPFLHPGLYVFCQVAQIKGYALSDTICTFREDEGWTLIMSKEKAIEYKLNYNYEAAWITLQTNTALDQVGVTALFSKALADRQISCNIVAAFNHDHLFVPFEHAQLAIETLEKLSH